MTRLPMYTKDMYAGLSAAEAHIRLGKLEGIAEKSGQTDLMRCHREELEKAIKERSFRTDHATSQPAMLDQRGSRYGDFFGHARAAQDIKGVIHAHLGRNPNFKLMTPAEKAVIEEGLDMIAHKIGRIVNGDPKYYDSWDDIGGYAEITRKRVAPRPNESK